MLLVRIPGLVGEVGDAPAGMRVAGEGEEPLQPQDAAQRGRAVAERDGAAAQQLPLAQIQLAPQPVDPLGRVVGQRRGHVVDRRVDVCPLGDPAPDVVLDERGPSFHRCALGQLAELLDEPPAVGAEEVLDEDALVADLVHGGTEDRGRVAGPEPDADRLEPLESVERLERPALHLGSADLDRPVGEPDHVDARVGDQVVGRVGVDDPGHGEPVLEVVGHGDGAEPGRRFDPLVRHGTVLTDEAGGPAPSRRWSVVGPPASCPCQHVAPCDAGRPNGPRSVRTSPRSAPASVKYARGHSDGCDPGHVSEPVT